MSNSDDFDLVSFTFRVQRGLKNKFVDQAKRRNRNASLILRDRMEEYVSELESAADQPAKARVNSPDPHDGQ